VRPRGHLRFSKSVGVSVDPLGFKSFDLSFHVIEASFQFMNVYCSNINIDKRSERRTFTRCDLTISRGVDDCAQCINRIIGALHFGYFDANRRIRSSKNFNICVSPAFASSIPLRTSSTSSPLSRASATKLVRFLEPGLRPPLPFSKGRPRAGEFGWGLGAAPPLGSGFATLISHSTRYATLRICWVLPAVLQI
jgi:hypothetical protein